MNKSLTALLSLLLAACAWTGQEPVEAPSEPAPSAGNGLRAHDGLRYECAVDSDCEIKDIGNCCGHYPACVHADSIADPQAVASECAERGLSGICGFPVIEACACREGRCEAAPSADETISNVLVR